jgi:predicted ArsR family transcriptional regulator
MRNNRKRILTLLEVSNGLTTSELCDTLDISATAIRRHLKTLEEQDLVSHIQEQRGIGRPSFVYRLKNGTPNGFSQSYGDFVKSVLDDADQVDGPAGLAELFRQRQETRYEPHVTQSNGETLQERVATLARLLEQDGRLTSWQKLDDGRYILRQHNCPLRQIAHDFEPACTCELSLFQEILKTEVQRLSHIADGDVACVYEILDGPHSRRGDRPRTQGESEGARPFKELRESALETHYAVAAD